MDHLGTFLLPFCSPAVIHSEIFFQKHLSNQELQIPLALDETWTLKSLRPSEPAQSYKTSCLILSIEVNGYWPGF